MQLFISAKRKQIETKDIYKESSII